jgi:hypothetical protein
MMAGIPAWRMEIKQQKKTQAPFALEAPSLEMGHEILSKRMSQTVLGVGGTILSTQRMRSQLPLNWIGEQSDLQLSISQLVQLLTRFQNEEPYVVVDFLSVGVIPPSQPDGLQSLAVRLAISAPLRVDSQPSRPRAVASHA